MPELTRQYAPRAFNEPAHVNFESIKFSPLHVNNDVIYSKLER